jgi:hypothetical protein
MGLQNKHYLQDGTLLTLDGSGVKGGVQEHFSQNVDRLRAN